jgi:hypothetical protein
MSPTISQVIEEMDWKILTPILINTVNGAFSSSDFMVKLRTRPE